MFLLFGAKEIRLKNTAQRWQDAISLTQTDFGPFVLPGNLDLNKLPALKSLKPSCLLTVGCGPRVILTYLQQRGQGNLRDFVSRGRRARNRLLLGQKWWADWG